MYYIRETAKPFEKAVEDLEKAVALGGFGVLHVHDIGGTLRSKGVDFAENCKVLEVCNPVQAGKVMSADMRLNMALPCRLSVYTEKGQTFIGMIPPSEMLAALSDKPELQQVAEEVEQKTRAMIDSSI